MKDNKGSYIAIDWGTTNFRAFLINSSGERLDQVEEPLGLLQIENQQFAESLEKILSGWIENYQHLPIYMAGMVGSAQGWVNVPYVETSVTTEKLANAVYSLPLPWGSTAYIVPGVCHSHSPKRHDVMRGEEVQCFGLRAAIEKNNFTAVFPGTHSKHIAMTNGELTDFSTYMTGELYSILSQHSILGHSLPKQFESNYAFDMGVRESKTENLSHSLFSVRTMRLFDNVKDEHTLNYLSGLLIGYELKELQGNHLYIVGNTELGWRYEYASELLSLNSTIVSGDDCFILGMNQIYGVLNA
ncbi:MFS transporter [Vibrio sp. MACH09]|uniref:2-dehydro-3-deoxygalactonokinase n=1 Tax=Vibrio sp. MACH09 TaxID=3025122 RepID=UPI00279167DC|nr:2-dehydro-3-deoxygalactonokinase [Vibrio sp. MACH09]GLO63983.1 MFS transporter [Vibrio sp. MACH09]